MYMWLRNICCLCGMVVFLVACAKPPITQQDVHIEPTLSAKLDMPKLDTSTSNIYVYAHDMHGLDTKLTQALQQALRAKGYTITENPRSATHIMYSAVVYMGTMSAAVAHKTVSEGYCAPVRVKSFVSQDMAEQETLFTTLVVDTLVATRDLPTVTKRVSEVVATASQDTTTGHHTVRLAATVPVQSENTDMSHYLVGRMASAIVDALP